jgi:hypothetical protein
VTSDLAGHCEAEFILVEPAGGGLRHRENAAAQSGASSLSDLRFMPGRTDPSG